MALGSPKVNVSRVGPDGSAPVSGDDWQKAQGLAQVLRRLVKLPKPPVLFWGPLCGDSLSFLGGRGLKVHVEPFHVPGPTPPKRPGRPRAPAPPFRLDFPDGAFAAVLAWELIDFVPPDRLEDWGGELARVLRPGGWLHILSRTGRGPDTEPPPRYRILDDDRVRREPSGIGDAPRFEHPPRDVERFLGGFSVETSHLLRNRLREYVLKRLPDDADRPD